MGEYQRTYDQIDKCNEKIKKLKNQLKHSDGMTSDERDYLAEELGDCEIAKGELQGYLAELNYIDNGNNYNEYEW